jgi:hypothetical protein
MIVIYDVNGYFAGMHSVIPARMETSTFPSPAPSSPVQPQPWARTSTYVTTAYFVNVNVICTGRSADDFAMQGTGYR